MFASAREEAEAFQKDLSICQSQYPSEYAEILRARLLDETSPHDHDEKSFCSQFKLFVEKLKNCEKQIEISLNDIMEKIRAANEYISLKRNNPRTNLKDYIINPYKKYFDNMMDFWRKLTPTLEDIYEDFKLERFGTHTFGRLFHPDCQQFLNDVEFGQIPIGEEVGFLALARLIHISNNATLTPQIKIKAKRLVCSPLFDELLMLDEETLRIELVKLLVHKQLFSDRNKVWIGTARSVEAMITNYPGAAAYLNPDVTKYSWLTNKYWLLAASLNDYKVELVEQHYPNVINGIKSANPIKFVFSLLSELRGEDIHSQYNSSISITATPQEILLLMFSGIKASINADKRIILTSRHKLSTSIPNPSIIPRSHSFSIFSKSLELPPLEHLKDHFQVPSTCIVPFNDVQI